MSHTAQKSLATALTTLASASEGVLESDPSTGTLVNTAAADSRFTLGRVYRYGDKWFRYVQFKDAVVYAAGNIAFQDAALDGSVTVDVSEAASATKPEVAGVVLGVQTENYYGWIQTWGVGTVLHNNDDDAAIGDVVIATAADNGVCNVGTWTPALGVGVGRVAVVAGTNLQSVHIKIEK